MATVTLSTIPDTTKTLYKGQKLYLTVKATSGTPMTGTHTIKVVGPTADMTDTTNGFAFDTSVLGLDYSASQPLVMDSGNLTGTATFVLDVKLTATAANLTLHITSDLSLGATPIDPLWGAPANELAPQPLGPSNPFVAVPTADNLTPVSGADYMNVFSITMLDPSTSKGVPYCVVDWHEAKFSDIYKDLFTKEMNTYLTTNGAVVVDDNTNYWPNNNTPLAKDPDGETKFIRTITGSDGVSTLYLVAKQSTAPVVASLEVWPGWPGSHTTSFFSVAQVDETTISLMDVAPDPGDIDAATGFVDYTADSDPTVPVNLNLSSKGVTPGDLIYTFINGELGSFMGWSASDADKPYQSTFPKKGAHTGPDLADQNQLQFLWVDLENRNFNVSAIGYFYGEHDPNSIPLGGTLTAPYLPDAGNTIDDTVVASPTINVALYVVSQSTSSPPWIPAPLDEVTITANILGYDKNGQPRNPLPVTSTKYPLTPGDITATFTLIPLTTAPFKGWSHSVAGNNYRSTFSMYYIVKRPSTGQQWTSKSLNGYVMTPNS